MDQIRYFISEMKDKNAYFGRIRILGGEPTINRNFQEITALLHDELVLSGHIGHLEVITNGTHPEKIEPVKKYLERVRISGEREKARSHVANLVHSPKSLGYEGKMCGAPGFCGWSLNHFGYFPCSSGAGLARFMDDMPRWQLLSLPMGKTLENWPNLQELCNFCYHALRDEDKIKSGTSDPSRNKPSPENQALLDGWLAGRQPTLPVYGQLTGAPTSA